MRCIEMRFSLILVVIHLLFLMVIRILLMVVVIILMLVEHMILSIIGRGVLACSFHIYSKISLWRWLVMRYVRRAVLEERLRGVNEIFDCTVVS